MATDLLTSTASTAPTSASPGRRRLHGGSVKIGVPFVLVHLSLVGLVFVGWSPVALAVAVLSYVFRALGITVVFHRALAHRAFTMPRPVQAIGATIGTAAAQRGPLWWIAHHRIHHRHTDRPADPHSPVTGSLAWSHLLWLFAGEHQQTDLGQVRDLARFREMRLLDRFHHVVTGSTAVLMLGLGWLLATTWPGLGTSGPQLLIWGFCVPTVALWHSTFAINSVAHRWGHRRFETADASRNNWLLSVLTLGEGWHNNHHRYPVSARQGFARRELDPSWWVIRGLAALRLAKDLRPVPAPILAEAGLGSGLVDGARARRGGPNRLDRPGEVAGVAAAEGRP